MQQSASRDDFGQTRNVSGVRLSQKLRGEASVLEHRVSFPHGQKRNGQFARHCHAGFPASISGAQSQTPLLQLNRW